MIERDDETPGKSLFEVLRRRGTVALVTFLVVALAAYAFVKVHRVKYSALSHVVLVNDLNGRDPSAAGVDMPTIATGSSVLLDVRQQLGLSASINDLRKAVNARIAPKSSLLTISVQDTNPKSAIEIDNAIADSFAKLYRQLAGSRYEDVTQRLGADVDLARARLGGLERRLESASADVTYVGSQTSLDASASHLADLQQSRGVALAQLATDRANLQADREQPHKTAKIIRHEILDSNPTYHETALVVGKDVAQYTATRAGLTDHFPGLAGYAEKVKEENRALGDLRSKALDGSDAYSPMQGSQIVQRDKDEAAVKGDGVKVDAIEAQMRAIRDQLTTPAAGVPSIGALRAERDAAEAQLVAMSQRLSNAKANSAESSSLGEVVVVDRATEARPTLVGPATLLELGLAAALVLAIAAAYLAEFLVPRLLGPGDVEAVYGRPILATLRARSHG